MPGPKPTPTELKLVRGNPGHQKLPQNEPKPRPLRPNKPSFGANKAASRYWDRLIPILEDMRVLTEADGFALKDLSIALALRDEAERGIERARKADKLVYITSNNSQALCAWFTLKDKAEKTCERGYARFGLGPADRTKIEVSKPDAPSNPLQAIRAQTARRKQG